MRRANAGSATSSAYVGSWTQTCKISWQQLVRLKKTVKRIDFCAKIYHVYLSDAITLGGAYDGGESTPTTECMVTIPSPLVGIA